MMHVIEGPDGRPVLAFPSSQFVCAHSTDGGAATIVTLGAGGDRHTHRVEMPLSLFLKAANLEPKK